MSKGKIIGYLTLCHLLSPLNFLPFIFNYLAVFMPIQEDTVPLGRWSWGWGSVTHMTLMLIAVCLREFGSSSWFGGPACSYDLKRPLIIVGVFKVYWEISQLLDFSPLPSSFYMRSLFLTLETCIAQLSTFRVPGAATCSGLFNNRGVSLAQKTKEAVADCVAKPPSEDGPS